jgi:hypothetical protein
MYSDRPSGLTIGWFAAPTAAAKPQAFATPFEAPSRVRHPALLGSCVAAPLSGSRENTVRLGSRHVPLVAG